MLLVYSIIFIITLIISTVFSKYKKDIRETACSKKNLFTFFYGLSFAIIDLSKTAALKLNGSNGSTPVNSMKKKLSLLHPGIDVENLAFLTAAKRISVCIAIFMFFILLGIIFCLNRMIAPSSLESLERPTDGSENATYSLQITSEDETQYIDLEVSKKIYEYSQVISLFDKYREDLIQSMLGENPSVDKITYPLYFTASIGTEEIQLEWQPENSAYIDFNGNIIQENISPEGTSTSIYVSMELDGITASLVIGVTLYPIPITETSALKSEIQNYITLNNSPDSDSVLLPSKLSIGNVQFSVPSNDNECMFLILAALSLPILYILSSREISIRIKKRNRQMMHDYPEIVAKLLLLSSAGLNIHNSLKKIVKDYKSTIKPQFRYAYQELSVTVNSLEAGKSETSAYEEFGRRCGLMPYIKLGALLEQNIMKGSRELRYHLNSEVKNAFENHRADTLTRSKQAETKLLFPMIMILIIIMALIIVPSFMKI